MDALVPLDSVIVAMVQGVAMPESRLKTNPMDHGVAHPHVDDILPPGSMQMDPFWICE